MTCRAALNAPPILALSALFLGGAPQPLFAQEADARDVPSDEPAAAARRRHLVEPLGNAPSPWAALAGTVETAVRTDGAWAASALRIHVPVASHYGAADFRLAFDFNDEGLRLVSPQLCLRALPLQLAEGRGVLGVAGTMTPGLASDRPTLVLRGGIMGGYLWPSFVAWGYVGVAGDPLEKEGLAIEGTIALAVRSVKGFNPGVELEGQWDVAEDQWTFVFRPFLRFWPTESVGLGVSAQVPHAPVEGAGAVITFDVVGHAAE